MKKCCSVRYDLRHSVLNWNIEIHAGEDISCLKCSWTIFLLKSFWVPIKRVLYPPQDIWMLKQRMTQDLISSGKDYLVSLMVWCNDSLLKVLLFSFFLEERVDLRFYLTEAQFCQVYIEFILFYHPQNVIMTILGISGATQCQHPIQSFPSNRKHTLVLHRTTVTRCWVLDEFKKHILKCSMWVRSIQFFYEGFTSVEF